MATRIQLRRDTTANWAAENPILAAGEFGVETDSAKRVKMGDGSTAWNSLASLSTAASQLTGDTLPAAIVNSSLTKVGTVTEGVWQATQIQDTYLAQISTAGKVANSATTATSANTASAIVARDASGDFTARNITATLFNGPAATANAVAVANVTGLLSGGKILSSLLPAIAITDTFVVASQVAMLALSAETGDVAVRTDQNKSYILKGSDPTVLGNWQELLTPTDAVLSVAGRVGAVTLVSADITDATSTNTASRVVVRDASGNFAAAAVTVTTLTSGAINGQTVSSAANFTGTVTIATGLTVSAGTTSVQGLTSTGVTSSGNVTSTTGNIVSSFVSGAADVQIVRTTTGAMNVVLRTDTGYFKIIDVTNGRDVVHYTTASTGAVTMNVPSLTLGNGVTNSGSLLNMIGWGATNRNWQISTAIIGTGIGLAFTPSTVAAGSTFTTAAVVIGESGSITMSGKLIVNDGGNATTAAIQLGSAANGLSLPSANQPVMVAASTEIQRWTATGTSITGSTTGTFDGSAVNGYVSSDTRSSAGTDNAMQIKRNGVEVGTITTTLAATAYNTSSDARLKKDLGLATDCSVLRDLRIHKFAWVKARGGHRARGVFAQEAYEVAPWAVDVGSNEVDDNGNLVKPWGVEYGRFVPDLIVGWQNHDRLMRQTTSVIEDHERRITKLETALAA